MKKGFRPLPQAPLLHKERVARKGGVRFSIPRHLHFGANMNYRKAICTVGKHFCN